MTKHEYFLNKYYELRKKNFPKTKEFYETPSKYMIEPFRIADNLYYVGDKKVCVHLIDSGDGLILLDSGYPYCTHMLIDSIWRAGFDPKNVRWIIHSHGHFDHFGASNEFRNMYGTKLAISRADAQSLREKPQRAHLNLEHHPFAYTPTFDREIEDGEIFELGNVKIRCVLTPGHNLGVLSFFFDVTDNGTTYLAGMFGGAGVNALTLPYMAFNEMENLPEMMLASVEKIRHEPVIVHLGNHPGNNRTIEKREKQLSEGGNPFIDPDSWKNFMDNQVLLINTKIEQNKAMEAEYNAFVGIK